MTSIVGIETTDSMHRRRYLVAFVLLVLPRTMLLRVLRSANAPASNSRWYRAFARACRANCYLCRYVLAPIHLCVRSRDYAVTIAYRYNRPSFIFIIQSSYAKLCRGIQLYRCAGNYKSLTLWIPSHYLNDIWYHNYTNYRYRIKTLDVRKTWLYNIILAIMIFLR